MTVWITEWVSPISSIQKKYKKQFSLPPVSPNLIKSLLPFVFYFLIRFLLIVWGVFTNEKMEETIKSNMCHKILRIIYDLLTYVRFTLDLSPEEEVQGPVFPPSVVSNKTTCGSFQYMWSFSPVPPGLILRKSLFDTLVFFSKVGGSEVY